VTKKTNVFPWFSSLSLMLLATYFYCVTNPNTVAFYTDNTPLLPSVYANIFFSPHWQLLIMAAAFSVVLWDLYRFNRRLRIHTQQHQHLQDQLQELTATKKQLQRKAHTFSNQTDKLKTFIGDRLLEYIEYDEKFLHFKGIAAEVRHNGIICYDKLLQALTQAQTSDSDNSLYPEALTSLGYLWDLLDLSTADNIALHINNHICECEEYYYQEQLNRERLHQGSSPTLETSPYAPTFKAHDTFLRALVPLMNEEESATLIDAKDHSDNIIYNPQDSLFRLNLDTHCELLGNENHIVLAVENLVKNALFYSAKPRAGTAQSKKHNKVILSLSRADATAHISIYNHGPHIPEEIGEHIFKLGYTTRRAKDVNGRGLGLYFVNQIVNGYEGKITQRNIHNQPETYSIRIELAGTGLEGNRVVTDVVETCLVDESIRCSYANRETDNVQPEPTLEWSFSQPLISIEITGRSTGKTYIFNTFDDDKINKFTDPDCSPAPLWAMEAKARPRSCKLTFIPLDITGVEFGIQLPLAEAQFVYEAETIESEGEEYISGMEDKFTLIDRTG